MTDMRFVSDKQRTIKTQFGFIEIYPAYKLLTGKNKKAVRYDTVWACVRLPRRLPKQYVESIIKRIAESIGVEKVEKDIAGKVNIWMNFKSSVGDSTLDLISKMIEVSLKGIENEKYSEEDFWNDVWESKSGEGRKNMNTHNESKIDMKQYKAEDNIEIKTKFGSIKIYSVYKSEYSKYKIVKFGEREKRYDDNLAYISLPRFFPKNFTENIIIKVSEEYSIQSIQKDKLDRTLIWLKASLVDKKRLEEIRNVVELAIVGLEKEEFDEGEKREIEKVKENKNVKKLDANKINEDKDKDLSLYKDIVVLLGNYSKKFPGTGYETLFKEMVKNGIKVMPSDELALKILSKIIHSADSEPMKVQSLSSLTFDGLTMDVRPIYMIEDKENVAYWNIDGKIINKVANLIDYDGSHAGGKAGFWSDEKGEKVKLSDFLYINEAIGHPDINIIDKANPKFDELCPLFVIVNGKKYAYVGISEKDKDFLRDMIRHNFAYASHRFFKKIGNKSQIFLIEGDRWKQVTSVDLDEAKQDDDENEREYGVYLYSRALRVLQIPEGESIYTLPFRYYTNLAKGIGKLKVIQALLDISRGFRDSDPILYDKVKRIVNRLSSIASENRINEADDTYKVVARSIEDKDVADKIASDKKGKVVQDDKDSKKFMVIVSESVSKASQILTKVPYDIKVGEKILVKKGDKAIVAYYEERDGSLTMSVFSYTPEEFSKPKSTSLSYDSFKEAREDGWEI